MNKVFSFVIMCSVSTIILATALVIIRSSLIERHSSPKLIAAEIKEINQDFDIIHTLRRQQAVNSPTGTIQLATQPPLPICNISDITSYSNNYRSLVRYLDSKGESSTFTHRVELAHNNNMPEYRGTANENFQLLRTLVLKDAAAAGLCTLN